MTKQYKTWKLLAVVWMLSLFITASVPQHPHPEEAVLTPISVHVYVPPVKFYIPDIPLSRTLQEYTYHICLREQVDYELALAVMWSESRFQEDAVHHNKNGTTDSGLMQINDISMAWLSENLSITDLMDTEQNILAGITLLGTFLSEYEEIDALLAYNMGERGMKNAKAQGLQTTAAVERLLQKRDAFKQLTKYP